MLIAPWVCLQVNVIPVGVGVIPAPLIEHVESNVVYVFLEFLREFFLRAFDSRRSHWPQ